MITLGVAIAVTFTASTTEGAVLMAYLGNGSPAQRVMTTSLVHWQSTLTILIIVGVRTDLVELAAELIAISITTFVILAGLA